MHLYDMIDEDGQVRDEYRASARGQDWKKYSSNARERLGVMLEVVGQIAALLKDGDSAAAAGQSQKVVRARAYASTSADEPTEFRKTLHNSFKRSFANPTRQ